MSEPLKDLSGLSREDKLALLARLARQKERASRSFPLSFAQQRLWFLDRLDPGNYANNIFRAVTWDGPLNAAALGRALSEVVRRHESLRTTFPEVEGEPRQKVAPAADLPLPVENLRHVPAEERSRRVRELAVEESRRPFDLANGPVFRTRLVQLAEEEHVLFLAMHHIVSDGWSMGVLFRELTALYRAFAGGLPAPSLPELPVQYPDFAAWQRERLSGDRLDGELAWWRERLAGFPDYLELPTDHLRPPGGSFRGAIEPFTLPPEMAEALRALARQEGSTPFMVLLAAFEILLYRYSEQETFLVATNVAGRNRTELEGVIGFFAEILLLRARLDRGLSFRELLAWVQRDTLDAQEHQELPFERLVEELQPDRHLSHNPLYQVLFVLQNTPGGSVELPGVRLGNLALERALAKLDLTLDMVERGDVFAGFFEYNTDLFERATIARLTEHFLQLLAGIVADPDRRVGDLPLLTPEERRRALVEWNPAFSGSPGLVPELVSEQARRTPDAPAVLFGDGILTFAELEARSNRLARSLRRLGVGLDAPVGVCLERSLAMPLALLGVIKAGGAWVPLDPAYPRERLAVIVEDTAMPVLLTTRDFASSIPAGNVRVVCLDDPGFGESEDPSAPAWEICPEGLAYIIYTSGSTGRPKGVGVPHFSLANHASACAERYALGPADRALQFTSISFDITSEEIFPTWIAGGAVVPRPPGLFPSFDELHGMIERYGITIANLPTAYWHEWVSELVRSGGRPPAPLRTVIVGTEQALPQRVAEWLEVAPDVAWINGYASTEATVTALTYEPDISDVGRLRVAQRVPVGQPITNCRVYVLDAALEPVPVGIHGDVYIGGPNVSRGYLGWPDRTAASFIPDPFAEELGYGPGQRLYRQGDRGRYLPDGTVECVGRSDFQVKIRGFRIEPGEIEAVLARHPAVRECVVLVHEDAPGDRRLVGYAALEPGKPAVGEDLRAFLRGSLPDHMVPSAMVTMEMLPLNVNGKIDRRALARLAPAPAQKMSESPAPRNPAEEVVAGIWSELLRREQIGVEESFFDLGGHSLLATQLIARLREAFGVDLPLRTVFETPTVAGLAEAVEAARRNAEGLQMPPVVPVPRAGSTLPCSFAQQRLWILDRLHPDSPVYNMPLPLRLRGKLDASGLGRALDEIVRRHEALRTTFAAVGGQPVQVISEPAAVLLARLDLGLHADPAAEAGRWLLDEALRPFDLATGPLLRCTLLRLSEEDHVLAVTMHHIVSDGWSMNVFLRELTTLYSSFVREEASPLPELPIQYADFAAWQREWLQGEVLERQIRSWRDRLAGSPVAIELPADRPRPPVQTSRGGRQPLVIPAERVRELRTLGRTRRATLFMVLLAGFDAFLSRLSGQDDILVGTPVAGRTRREMENLIGFFVNTLVLRADLSGLPSFPDLLSRVRERALEAYTHQDLPFERLVEELRPERHLSHNPIFQVLFVLHHAGGSSLSLPGLEVSQLGVDNHTSRFDLLLSLAESGDELRGYLEYNADLFDAATAARFAGHLQTLLAAVAAGDNGPADHLPLLDETERLELLRWNDTAEDFGPEASLHHLIEVQAARTPEEVAVVFEGARLTYRELDLAASALAARLRALGAGPESLVGVAMERSLELLVALLGILKAGAAYVPLDPGYPRERLAFMLEDSGVGILLSQERLAASLPAHDGQLLLLDSLPAPEPGESAGVRIEPDGLAYMIYTSGSTGRPKGALNTHRGIRNRLLWMQRAYGLVADDVVLQKTPFSFDVSVWEFFWPLLAGARLVVARPGGHQDAAYLARLIADEGVTTLHFVPSMLQAFLEQKDLARCAGLRRVICSGEALPHDLQQRFFSRMPAGVELHNLYGPTEAAVDVTFWRCAPEAPRVPIGRPVSNTRIHLLDREMQPVPAGVAGELYIAGVQLARGYHGRPELTAERFVPDPAGEPGARLYRTGDLARWLADGAIDYLGRVDFQVKVRGFRIELGEIESALAEHPGVREAVVLARADGAPGDLRLVAYVVPTAAEPEVAVLRAFLKNRLPEYMVPAHFLTLDALPLTPSGKVDRKSLPAPDGPRRSEAELAPAQGPVEEKVAAIWAEVLRLDRVGAQENFFELGGHSLLATQVLSRVQETFNVELALRAFFEAPTVAGLAQAIFENEVQQADAGLLAELLANLEQQATQGEEND